MKRAVYHSPVWLMFPAWLILLGAFFGRIGMLVYENHLFATSARHVDGTVLRKIVMPLRDHKDSTCLLLLLYSYTAENLRGRCVVEVELATFQSVKAGGPIPIAYLPGSPTDNRIDFPWENAAARWGPVDDFVFAMFVFVPGICLVWYFGSRNRIHARLTAAGATSWGEVTALRKTHYRAASDTYLTFRFTTPEGREIKGRTPSLQNGDGHWREGDLIHVFFDPRKPEHFAVDLRHPLEGLVDEKPKSLPLSETMWA